MSPAQKDGSESRGRSARLSGIEGWHLVRTQRLSVVRDSTASSVVFVLALSADLLLGQSTFYKGDGQAFVASLSTGDFEHPYHLLYPRLLQGFASLLGGMDVSHLRIGTALSALGAAIGVAMFHATCRNQGLGPLRALFATLLVATAAPVVFFATVVEVHGPFLAFASLAWWTISRLERHASIAGAVGCGLATALATAAHATGHLLVGLATLWVLASRPTGPRVRWIPILWLTHVAGVLLLSALLRSGSSTAAAGTQLEFLGRYLHEFHGVTPLAGSFVHEWLLAFLPLSVLWLAALRLQACRLQVLALAVAVVAYCVVTLALLGDDVERGAYLIPLAFPAAVLAARSIPPWMACVAIALASVLSVAQIQAHDRPPAHSSLAHDLRVLSAGEDPYFIFGFHDEVNAVLIAWPEARFVPVYDWIPRSADPGFYENFCESFRVLMAGLHARSVTVYMTVDAMNVMTVDPTSPLSRFAREYLAEHFVLTPVSHGATEALRITVRKV